MFLNKYNFLVEKFALKDSSRIELTGIFVSPKETCATDGVKMIKVDTPKNFKLDDYPKIPNKPKPLTNFKSFILPKEKAKDILNLFKTREKDLALPILNNAIIVRNDKTGVEIGMTDLKSWNSIFSQRIEGEYPRYKDLFVERGNFIEIEVDVKFLKDIIDFYTAFQDKTHLKIKVPTKPNEPIRFEMTRRDEQQAKALLMPIKSE